MDIKVATETFLEIKKVLDHAGVRFWLVDGAALGIVRDGGLIPWDADIDMRVMATEWDFPVMFEKFKDKGFRCKKSISPKLYKDKPLGSVFYKQGIRVEMCMGYYYPPEDLIVVLAKHPTSGITVLPASFFRGEYFVEFLGVKVRVPNPPEGYFDLHYGKDWRIPTRAKKWSGNVPISITKYVKYFNEYPQINQKKAGNNV